MEFFIRFRYDYKKNKLLEFGACSTSDFAHPCVGTSFFGNFSEETVTNMFTRFYDYLAGYSNGDSPHEFIAWGHEDAQYAKELYTQCETQKGCIVLALLAAGTYNYLEDICNFLGRPYVSLTSVYQYFKPEVTDCDERGNAEEYAKRLEYVYWHTRFSHDREEMRKTLGEAYYQVDPAEIRRTLDKLGGKKHLQYLPVGTIYTKNPRKKKGGPTQVFASIDEAADMLFNIVGKSGVVSKERVAEKIRNAIRYGGNYGGFGWRVKKADKEVQKYNVDR